MLIGTYYAEALDGLSEAIVPEGFGGKREMSIIAKGAAGIRSTYTVDFHTSRDVQPVQKCHLSALVADTATWEQSAAFALDKHLGVLAWIKNDPLGFEIAYRRDHSGRRYLPDFIARLDNGLNLIIEIKGRRGSDAETKAAAAKRWVDAVNRHGGYGHWVYAIVYDPTELAKVLDKVASRQMAQNLEGAAEREAV